MLMGIQLIQKKQPSIPLIEQVDFLDRLSKLLSNHFTLRRSLEFMLYDPKHSDLAKQFVHLLQTGESIENCFRKLSFHPFVIAFLYFSKETGQMTEQIINCHNMLKMRLDFRKKLKEIMRYPLILLTFSMVIFFCMSTFLLPMFNQVIDSFGNDSSNFWLNIVISLFQTFIFVGASLLTVLSISFYLYNKRADLRNKLEVIERIPILKPYIKLSTTAQLSYHLSSIMNNGKTLKEALIIISKQNDLPILKYYSNQIIDQLKEGATLSKAINDLSLLEPDFKILILRSAEQGTLMEDLKAYSSLALASLEDKTKRLIFTIQPILYGVLGTMIILIYILTLIPMFQIMNYM
ncbi:competence type IV pilus assembly protein ComGB [Alkalibacillus silvisoli]|uniref:Competence type IV pilus assembly protein ComGB n=1 Tax=Alkalibacillus silvisoli TaxID=392823 RepID=A0ABN0ZSX2_9BACI